MIMSATFFHTAPMLMSSAETRGGAPVLDDGETCDDTIGKCAKIILVSHAHAFSKTEAN